MRHLHGKLFYSYTYYNYEDYERYWEMFDIVN